MKAAFKDLAGKTVLVTGASRGIGRSIALALGENGAHVVLNYRAGKESVAQDLTKELMNRGASNVTSLEFDVSDTEQMKAQVEGFLKGHKGGLHGLVNNAGIAKDQLLLRLNQEEVVSMLDVNLKGAMLLTSMASRFLMKAGGSVVNISSIIGLMGNTGQATYATSKAGLIGFTKSVAKELGGKKVRCNAVCPGWIATDMTKDANVEKYQEAIPLKRVGAPEEVADLVCFLLSDASAYITGETIKIDGGLYI